MEELPARLVNALVGVGPEVVALGLHQVGGKGAAAVAVEVGQGAAEGRGPEAVQRGGGHHLTPGGLTVLDDVGEVRVQEQVGEVRVLVVGGLDVLEEAGPDDAALAPHQAIEP